MVQLKLLKFSKILPTITITGNRILLKDNRMIILPKSLQLDAIKLAHQGSHLGETGVQRLQHHFFFCDLNEKVHLHIASCKDCQVFTNKKTSEPMYSTCNVGTKCLLIFLVRCHQKDILLWSRIWLHDFLLERLFLQLKPHVKSLLGILTINCPIMDHPLNCKTRYIHMEKTPLYHPSINPVETFMKSIGKTMRITHHNNISE